MVLGPRGETIEGGWQLTIDRLQIARLQNDIGQRMQDKQIPRSLVAPLSRGRRIYVFTFTYFSWISLEFLKF